jgi:hypothetical protein
MGEIQSAYKILVVKPEEKIRRYIWNVNIKMDFKETGYKNLNRIKLVQNSVQWRALVNMVMKIWVP